MFPRGRSNGLQTESKNGVVKCRAKLKRDGKAAGLAGEGNVARWPRSSMDSAVPGCRVLRSPPIREHALGSGEGAAAIAYIQIRNVDGKSRWGAGVDTNIELASIKAVLSALNRQRESTPAC